MPRIYCSGGLRPVDESRLLCKLSVVRLARNTSTSVGLLTSGLRSRISFSQRLYCLCNALNSFEKDTQHCFQGFFDSINRLRDFFSVSGRIGPETRKVRVWSSVCSGAAGMSSVSMAIGGACRPVIMNDARYFRKAYNKHPEVRAIMINNRRRMQWTLAIECLVASGFSNANAVRESRTGSRKPNDKAQHQIANRK